MIEARFVTLAIHFISLSFLIYKIEIIIVAHSSHRTVRFPRDESLQMRRGLRWVCHSGCGLVQPLLLPLPLAVEGRIQGQRRC